MTAFAALVGINVMSLARTLHVIMRLCVRREVDWSGSSVIFDRMVR